MESIGTSLKDYQLTGPELERFWAKVEKSADCWEWTAGLTKNGGYGQFTIKRGKNIVYVAHRLAYVLAKGDPGAGKQLDHICHNRRCVNPDHLRPVDHKQNSENHQGPTRKNTSGVRGVYWHAGGRKWTGQVGHNGVRYNCGMYHSIAEAEAAIIELRNKLFTHNDIDRIAA
jgi:hypothetical protein